MTLEDFDKKLKESIAIINYLGTHMNEMDFQTQSDIVWEINEFTDKVKPIIMDYERSQNNGIEYLIGKDELK